VNVLVLSHLFPSAQDPSAGIFVLEQLRSLRRLGVQAEVVAPTPWAPRWLRMSNAVRRRMNTAQRESMDGFLVERPAALTPPRRIGFSLLGFLYYLGCRARVAAHLQQHRLDLIHAHTILPDGFAAVLLGKEFHLPTVCTLHGSDIKLYPKRSRATHRATTWALRHVDRLIAVSADLRKESQAMSGRADVAVVPNGADEQVFVPIPRLQARTQLGLPPHQKIVSFIGYLRPEKSLTTLLEAFSRLANMDCLLYFVGDGPSKSELMARAAMLGILERCRFVGHQAHSDVPLWLSAADCLALSSLSEGLPTILPEAMLCHVPIVTTPAGGISEIVRDGKTGIVVPFSDPAALAHAVEKIVDNSALTDELTTNAYTFAKSSLTWTANARSTLALYEDLLRQYAPSAAKSVPEVVTTVVSP